MSDFCAEQWNTKQRGRFEVFDTRLTKNSIRRNKDPESMTERFVRCWNSLEN